MPKKALSVAALLILASLARVEADAAGSAFKVIANPAVKGGTITRVVLAQVFLGRVEKWGNGTPITPIDLSAMSPVRAAFSEGMLGMPTAAVRRYWEQRLADGRRPPPVKTSAEEMIAAVAAAEGAIGYVPMDTPIPESVKVIEVQ